jgi:hypothetical protein
MENQTSFPQLTSLEHIIFDGRNVAHIIEWCTYDESKSTFSITVSPLDDHGFNRTYLFEGVSNYSIELEDVETFDDFPKPIIGMDFYDNPHDNKFNVVINCAELEFTFNAEKLPERIK